MQVPGQWVNVGASVQLPQTVAGPPVVGIDCATGALLEHRGGLWEPDGIGWTVSACLDPLSGQDWGELQAC